MFSPYDAFPRRDTDLLPQAATAGGDARRDEEPPTHYLIGTLFATGDRLLARLMPAEDATAEDRAKVDRFRRSAATTFFSLDLNLAKVGDDYRLVPQLRLSDYWPRSGQVAPPRLPPDDGIRRPAAGTAMMLNTSLWVDADDAIQVLLRGAGIAPIEMMIGEYELRPPAFYAAHPVTPPKTPEEFLGPAFRSSVRELCREVLGCDDPLCDQVAGLFVEGNVALLRREFVLPIEAPQYSGSRRRTENQYLCLGWHDDPDPDDFARIELDLCFAAQRLSLLDIRIGVRLAASVGKIAEQASNAGPLERLIRDLNSRTTDLQDQAARARARKRRRKFDAMAGIGRTLLGRRAEIIAAVGQVDRLEREVQLVVDEVATETEKALASRPLGPFQPLTAARLRSGPVVRVASRRIEESKRTIALLNEESEKLSALLDAAITVERREAERRSGRHQRVLSYVLAGLAAVTALSLIIGQIDKRQIESAAAKWAGPFGILRPCRHAPFRRVEGLLRDHRGPGRRVADRPPLRVRDLRNRRHRHLPFSQGARLSGARRTGTVLTGTWARR